MTRLESVYKLEGLARARSLLARQSSTEQVQCMLYSKHNNNTHPLSIFFPARCMQQQSNLLHGACRAEVDPAVLNLLITECPRSDLNSTDKVSLHGIVDVNSEGYKTTTFYTILPHFTNFPPAWPDSSPRCLCSHTAMYERHASKPQPGIYIQYTIHNIIKHLYKNK